MNHEELLNVVFNISALIIGASMVVSLVARYGMKRKRMATKSGLIMLTAAAVAFSATALGNYLDGVDLSANVVGILFVFLMLLGVHSTWKKLKTLNDKN